MPSPHEIATSVHQHLLQCSEALDEAARRRGRDLLDVLTAPALHLKLARARKLRAAARRDLDLLHDALHDRTSLSSHGADAWAAIIRAVDALALSRWLNTASLGAADIAPARETVQILLRELSRLLALIGDR